MRRPTTDIVSDQKFWNFAAHIEFRIVEHSNSGIGLRGRYEIQILDDYGKPPQTHGAAALYTPRRPVGERQQAGRANGRPTTSASSAAI